MIIDDREWAERKLAQIGYYRLSGFWYPCRKFHRDQNHKIILSPVNKKPERSDEFVDGIHFDAVIHLYLFDKKLRQLILDAIERIEVHIRSVIAHELGYHDSLAYQKTTFIDPRHTQNFTDKKTGRSRNIWNEWFGGQTTKVNRSREDCILWHKKSQRKMPFWVVIEAWDFGTMSKYYEILKGSHQNRICSRLGISNAQVLKRWLKEINTLRNRCAHHTRVWNQYANNPLPICKNAYFDQLNLEEDARKRLYGSIAILWFLVKKIGPNSEWLSNIANVIDSKPDLPGCLYASMGFPDETGFPRDKFDTFFAGNP